MEWNKWENENGALEGETPFQLLCRLRIENRWQDIGKMSCPPDRSPEIWENEKFNFMNRRIKDETV